MENAYHFAANLFRKWRTKFRQHCPRFIIEITKKNISVSFLDTAYFCISLATHRTAFTDVDILSIFVFIVYFIDILGLLYLKALHLLVSDLIEQRILIISLYLDDS